MTTQIEIGNRVNALVPPGDEIEGTVVNISDMVQIQLDNGRFIFAVPCMCQIIEN